MHAKVLGLDVSQFQHCMDSGTHEASIRKDFADGRSAGVTGTPTFFLGLTEQSESRVKILKVLVGAQPYATFKEIIDGLLAPAPQTK